METTLITGLVAGLIETGIIIGILPALMCAAFIIATFKLFAPSATIEFKIAHITLS